MKKTLYALLGTLTLTILSGCAIVPLYDGYGYHDGYHHSHYSHEGWGGRR